MHSSVTTSKATSTLTHLSSLVFHVHVQADMFRRPSVSEQGLSWGVASRFNMPGLGLPSSISTGSQAEACVGRRKREREDPQGPGTASHSGGPLVPTNRLPNGQPAHSRGPLVPTNRRLDGQPAHNFSAFPSNMSAGGPVEQQMGGGGGGNGSRSNVGPKPPGSSSSMGTSSRGSAGSGAGKQMTGLPVGSGSVQSGSGFGVPPVVRMGAAPQAVGGVPAAGPAAARSVGSALGSALGHMGVEVS